MKIENYKSAMQAVKTDENKYLELCDLIDGAEDIAQSEPANRRHKIRLTAILAAVLIIAALGVTTLAAAGSVNYGRTNLKEKNDILAGKTDDKTAGGAITIITCGPYSSVENIVRLYEEKYRVKVNVIKYDNDSDWNKFETKMLAQDTDFDLFVPVPAQLGSIIRNGLYQDLSAYEDVSSRIESNSLTEMISVADGDLIGVPYFPELFSTADSPYAMTLFKYCYKNVDLYTGELADPEGEELFEMLKHHYKYPDDEKENSFYDFEYSDASTSYVFMNKFSQKKEQAAEFLCFLFDVLNNDIESTWWMRYPSIEDGAEYVPSWMYYTYEFVEPIVDAFEAAAESDGSDEALRKLAREAVKGVKMRLYG